MPRRLVAVAVAEAEVAEAEVAVAEVAVVAEVAEAVAVARRSW